MRLAIRPIKKHNIHVMNMNWQISVSPRLLQSCLNNWFSNVLHPTTDNPPKISFNRPKLWKSIKLKRDKKRKEEDLTRSRGSRWDRHWSRQLRLEKMIWGWISQQKVEELWTSHVGGWARDRGRYQWGVSSCPQTWLLKSFVRLA